MAAVRSMGPVPDLAGRAVTGNYYGCESNRHTEFTCLSYSYINKRFTTDRWCDPCKQRYAKGQDNA